MSTRQLSLISFPLLFMVMAAIYYSSSMTYEEQSVVGLLDAWIPPGSLPNFLQNVHFFYAGYEVSVSALGDAAFCEFFLRKATHFLCFGTIGALAFLSLIHHLSSLKKAARLAVLWTFLYACLDEFRQSLNPGRSGGFQDILLDALGGLCLTLVTYCCVRDFMSRQLIKKE